jgi:hypothetical protein
MKCSACHRSFGHDFTICPKCGVDSRIYTQKDSKAKPASSFRFKEYIQKNSYRLGLAGIFIVSMFIIRLTGLHTFDSSSGSSTYSSTDEYLNLKDSIEYLMDYGIEKGHSDEQILDACSKFRNEYPSMARYEAEVNRDSILPVFTDKFILSTKRYKKFEPLPRFESSLEEIRLENGASPFDEIFGAGTYNKRFSNYIEIHNGSESDVVVLLKEFDSGYVFRNEYIQRGSTFKMTSIPNGTYYLQYYYGRHWSSNKTVFAGVTGGFLFDELFQSSNKYRDALKMDQSSTQYSIFEIDLKKREGGNMESQPIDDSDFFKSI